MHSRCGAITVTIHRHTLENRNCVPPELPVSPIPASVPAAAILPSVALVVTVPGTSGERGRTGSVCTRLTSLSVMASSTFTRAVACVRVSFLREAEWHPTVQTDLICRLLIGRPALGLLPPSVCWDQCAVNTGGHASPLDSALNSLGYMPVELLDRVVVLCSFFEGLSHFSVTAAAFCIPTNSEQEFQCSRLTNSQGFDSFCRILPTISWWRLEGAHAIPCDTANVSKNVPQASLAFPGIHIWWQVATLSHPPPPLQELPASSSFPVIIHGFKLLLSFKKCFFLELFKVHSKL